MLAIRPEKQNSCCEVCDGILLSLVHTLFRNLLNFVQLDEWAQPLLPTHFLSLCLHPQSNLRQERFESKWLCYSQLLRLMHLSIRPICPIHKVTLRKLDSKCLRKLADLHLVATVRPFSKTLPPSSPRPAEQAVLQEIKWRHAARSLMPQ